MSQGIEWREVDSLHPNPRNTRRHPVDQIQQIAASIEEFGWAQPILVSPDGQIIAGHGRWMAAQALQMTEVPCLVAEDWSAQQRAAYGVADNQIALGADWDVEMLHQEVVDLDEGGYDVRLMGLSDGEVSGFLDDDVGDDDEDEEPPRRRHVVVGVFKQELDPDVLEAWCDDLEAKHAGNVALMEADVFRRLGLAD